MGRIKKYLFSLLLGLLSLESYAQSPTWQWAVNNSLSGGTDKAGIVTDRAGNIYTTGTALSKFGPGGVLIWTVNLIDSTQGIYAAGLAIDSTDNLYLAGRFGGTVILDSITLTTAGQSDIFIAKFNPNGRVQWARTAGGPGQPPFPPSPGYIDDAAIAIATDAAGNSYITGIYDNTGISPVKFDNITMPANSGWFFAAKYNSSGKVQWVRPVTNLALSIAIGKQGSYYLAGGASGGIYTKKYSANGALLWQRNGVGSNQNWVQSMVVDKYDNCYITGSITSNTTFGNVILTVSTAQKEMFLIKYDSAGQVQFGRQSLGNNLSSISSEDIELDAAGNIYLTGVFSDTLTFGNLPVLSGSPNSLFVLKYNSAGNPVWVRSANGWVYGQAITARPNGDCFVTGYYKGNPNFDGNLLTGRNNDFLYFLAKLSFNTTGIKESPLLIDYQIFPNPVNKEVTISIKGLPQGNIQIFNSTGKQIYQYKLGNQDKFQISTENWQSGIYFIKLISESRVIAKRLIISH